MNWPIDEFHSTRNRVTTLCFFSLLIPSFILYNFLINIRQGNFSTLILATCIIHMYVSVMYAFPRLFSKYGNIFMLILGEEIMSGKGFENNKQKLFFIFSQGFAAASIVEISRLIIEFITEKLSFLFKELSIEPGIIYTIISTSLVTFFLFIGITRIREKIILREHWGSKRLIEIPESI